MSETETMDVVDRLAIVYGSTRDYRTGVYGQQLGQEMYQIIGSHEALSALPDAMDEIRRLRRELAEARKDAERYRWLRDKANTRDANPFICRFFGGSFAQWAGEHADRVIDAAIDAARKEG